MFHILLARGHFLLIFVNDLIRRWLSGTLANTPHYRYSSKEWNSTESLVLGSYLVTRIWVRSMIGLLKMPLSICQWRWKEIWNAFLVIHWVHCGGPRTRISVLLPRLNFVCDTGYHLSSSALIYVLWKKKQLEKNISLKEYITESESGFSIDF